MDISIRYYIFHIKPHYLTSTLLYILTKIKSETSTFVFKSQENKNHADKNYYQINK
jgi:hypothetical protein